MLLKTRCRVQASAKMEDMRHQAGKENPGARIYKLRTPCSTGSSRSEAD